MEEAGRKVILIPGDIASEEHIKCVGLSSGNPMVHPAYLCPCMQAWGFDAADCLCMCIRLQLGSDDRGDYVVHELWLEQSTCLCAGTLWQRLWTPLDASTSLSTMLQCRCFSPAKTPALNVSCWAHHAGSRERFSTWQTLCATIRCMHSRKLPAQPQWLQHCDFVLTVHPSWWSELACRQGRVHDQRVAAYRVMQWTTSHRFHATAWRRPSW